MSEDKRARLRWHCRRGMLELDVILRRFADRDLDRLGAVDLALFERLLEQSDPDLMDWLLKGEPVPDPELAGLVERIRTLSAD
jgi:antitoxin CptB